MRKSLKVRLKEYVSVRVKILVVKMEGDEILGEN